MWKRLKGKSVKIILKNGDKSYIRHGIVLDANDSFLVERDPSGKIHFLNVSSIERISEVSRESSLEKS